LRPQRQSDLPAYNIIIDDVSGGEIANILRGFVEVGPEKIRFTAIAYGRYGGQNVAPKLSNVAKKRLRLIFGDLARFEEDFQLRLVGGDFELRPRKRTNEQSSG
jgi:hypothetical protein